MFLTCGRRGATRSRPPLWWVTGRAEGTEEGEASPAPPPARPQHRPLQPPAALKHASHLPPSNQLSWGEMMDRGRGGGMSNQWRGLLRGVRPRLGAEAQMGAQAALLTLSGELDRRPAPELAHQGLWPKGTLDGCAGRICAGGGRGALNAFWLKERAVASVPLALWPLNPSPDGSPERGAATLCFKGGRATRTHSPCGWCADQGEDDFLQAQD